MKPSAPPQPAVPPALGIGVGILSISTGSILVRYAQAYAPSLVIAAYRLALAALVLGILAMALRRRELQTLRPAELGLALLSGGFLALHFATWITSLEYTTVASSVVLVDSAPLWVALLSPFTLKERVGSWARLGLALALLGGVVVSLSDTCAWQAGRLACPPLADFVRGRAFLGDLLALCGAWMWAGYLLIGRRLRSRLSNLSYIFLVYGMAALALVAVVGVRRLPAFGYPPAAYLWFVLLALVPQLLGHSSFNWALAYLPASVVSITLLGEPVGSTLLAFLLLGETPTIFKLFGAILILMGIYLASRQSA